ncbi:transmembrane protein, partial [Cricetulus griseus]
EKNQKGAHMAGAFLAFILGNLYFWLQFLLSWIKGLPQPGPRWVKLLRLSFCVISTILIVASILPRE